MFDTALLLLVCLAYVLLGGFVLANNPNSNINRALAYMSFSLVAWNITAFLEDNGLSLSATKILVAADFALAVIVLWFFYIFCRELSGKKTKLYTKIVTAVGALSIISTLTGETVSISVENNHVFYNYKSGYYLFLIFLVLSIIGGLSLLIQRYRKSSGLIRNQIKFIFLGLFLTALTIIITNVVLPHYFVVSPSITRLGIYSTLFFIGASAYTIVRHHFLDIRLLVARTIAYTLLLVSLVAISAGLLFSSAALFFPDSQVSLSAKITYALVALLLAFIFQPLRRFFDKATNRVFYRDAYDSQELLNDLNKSLVTTINLEELLGKVSKIITKNVNGEFCTFAIRIPKEQSVRIIGGHVQLQAEAVQHLVTAVAHISAKVIVSDDLPPTRQHIKDLMQKAGITVLVKMQGKVEGREQQPGFVLLGQKQSGSIYSSQDKTVLAIIADELVIAIQNSLRFEEIQQFNLTLQLKIDAATKQLRDVNSKLKELDKTKDEFISMASHQLRTPLTTVKGYLSMVLEGDTGKVTKSQADLLQRAFDGADRMVYLIGDLLNVSRLQSGKFVIENKPTNLAKLIESEIKQLQESLTNHQLKLAFHKPDNFPDLMLDETKILQVIINFMDNAIYYTPKGGSIDVNLALNDKAVNFTITDTGLGVPKAEQHHLFTKFYRAGNARKMRPDGTGLGLFMAKKVIVAQGGAIIFKSTEGKGSTFGFTFPLHTVQVK